MDYFKNKSLSALTSFEFAVFIEGRKVFRGSVPASQANIEGIIIEKASKKASFQLSLGNRNKWFPISRSENRAYAVAKAI
jgi:hypothetical protein